MFIASGQTDDQYLQFSTVVGDKRGLGSPVSHFSWNEVSTPSVPVASLFQTSGMSLLLMILGYLGARYTWELLGSQCGMSCMEAHFPGVRLMAGGYDHQAPCPYISDIT